MPRLPPHLLRRANSLSLDLAALLPACRNLASASNELRWLKEHVWKSVIQDKQRHLSELCLRRGRGVPLQYVLGSQPFGALDILCKPGVLIPRSETEAYTYRLIDLVKSGSLLGPNSGKLSILDFCTGTGCIPLALFSAFQPYVPLLSVHGVDVSPKALQLARRNLAHNVKSGSMQKSTQGQSLCFKKVDVFSDADIQALVDKCSGLDLMISNPPYISQDTWDHGRGDMGYSVRKYEPKLALVPQNHLPLVPDGLKHEDVFYHRLLDIAQRLKPRALLFEIGDEEQARRVIRFSHHHEFSSGKVMEIWRDWPYDWSYKSYAENSAHNARLTTFDGTILNVPIVGEGNVRAILLKDPVPLA